MRDIAHDKRATSLRSFNYYEADLPAEFFSGLRFHRKTHIPKKPFRRKWTGRERRSPEKVEAKGLCARRDGDRSRVCVLADIDNGLKKAECVGAPIEPTLGLLLSLLMPLKLGPWTPGLSESVPDPSLFFGEKRLDSSSFQSIQSYHAQSSGTLILSGR